MVRRRHQVEVLLTDTECTFAEASAGILKLLSMLMVALAPRSVGTTSVTLPIWVPRYVTLAVEYSPPDRGNSAYNVYCPMPATAGNRR
jgi:hypothetical protein